MNQLSDRLNRLSPSATLAMSQKSNELKAQGVDVINLSVGEPDFNTPDHIKEAAKKAVDDNFSRYSPVPGYPGTGEYLEKLSSTAFFAASLMWSGVLKSGSPTLKLMTSTPWAFNSLLFWDMANVAEGDKRFRRSDN